MFKSINTVIGGKTKKLSDEEFYQISNKQEWEWILLNFCVFYFLFSNFKHNYKIYIYFLITTIFEIFIKT